MPGKKNGGGNPTVPRQSEKKKDEGCWKILNNTHYEKNLEIMVYSEGGHMELSSMENKSCNNI